MAARGELLEHARVYGHSYGTPRAAVEQALAGGRDVLFDIDWQGAQQLRAAATDDMVGVFILPPSLPELERRLRGRAQDPEETVRFRLAQVSSDVTHWPEYDYVLVNKDFEASVAAVRAILGGRADAPQAAAGPDRLRRAVPQRQPRGSFVRCAARCHGQRPSISTSNEKLRKVRISTIPASTARLCRVGSTATVPMMSAATRNSSPSRMPRPRLARYSR